MSNAKLRLDLLAQGYVPLPAKGKACRLKGWTTVKVDRTEIEAWDAEQAWQSNTAIRCDGLVAVDVDVLDKAVTAEVYRLARDMLGQGALARVGRAPKVLLLYRPSKTMPRTGKPHAGVYVDAAGERHDVEVLLGPGHEFVAYGTHPDTGTEYVWSGGGPLAVARKKLPVISEVQLRDFLDECRKLFRERGWQPEERVRPEGAGDADFPRVYDLDDGTEIDVLSEPYVGPWYVADLEQTLRALGPDGAAMTLRCTLAGFREGADGNNGSVGLCGDGFLRVTDYRDQVVHLRPKDQRREDLTPEDRAALVGEGAAWFEELMSRWAYSATDQKCIRLSHPDLEYTEKGLRTLTREVEFESQAVVTKWLQHRDAKRCDVRAFDPRRTDERTFRRDGLHLINLYVPPAWGSVVADDKAGGIWNAYLDHLLPDARERSLFCDWLAWKVQHPWDRMVGVLMVADGVFGTGRGTMSNLLVKLFGGSYVKSPPFDVVAGKSNQGQYYDWLFDTLIVSVPEVLGETRGWKERSALFERMKWLVEPGAVDGAHLPRKRLRSVTTEVYASFFMATNHPDAFVLARNDRRFMVLSNGEKMGPAMVASMHGPGGLLHSPAQIAWVYQELMRREVTSNVFEAPVTAAKETMLERGQSDLDEAVDAFLVEVEPDYFCFRHFAFFVRLWSSYNDSDLPPPDDVRGASRNGLWENHGCKPLRGSGTRVSHTFLEQRKADRVISAPNRPTPNSTEAKEALDRVAVKLAALAKSWNVSVVGV